MNDTLELTKSINCNAMSNVAASYNIASAIGKVGESIKNAAEIHAEAVIESNKLIASSIMSGCQLIATGLKKIASEIERQTKFLEWSSLKDRIKEDEEWLYEHKLLKQFYEQVNLNTNYISSINPNMETIPFLVMICKSKHIDTFKWFFKGMEKCDWTAVLQEYCMTNKCDFNPYLIDLVSKNGVVFFRENEDRYRRPKTDFPTAYIRGTGFSLMIKDNKPFKQFPEAREFQRNKIVEPGLYGNTIIQRAYMVEFTPEKAEKFIAEQISSCKKDIICEQDRLNWENFYHRLNGEIALDNLRTLANEFENYVRNAKIQL